jgi:rubredoxin
MQFKIIGNTKNTGEDIEIILEAGDYKEAERKAIEMNVLVSKVLPVTESKMTTDVTGRPPGTIHTRLVETTCPECNGIVWSTERGCLFWFIAIGFFPLGLLIFLQQRKWKCVECDYFYHSYRAPASVKYFANTTAEYISSDEGPSQEDVDQFGPSQEDIDKFS